ncbi:MAG: low molecular weight protein-tyrosine-phosphatase [Dermatophilaceae bacterium]
MTPGARARPPYRVTVVCWGNICRSPMAEFMIRDAVAEAGLADRVEVDSGGISDEEIGSGIHPRTAAALRRNGHDETGWSAHRARQFEQHWFDRSDLVLAADYAHARLLDHLARDDADRAAVRLVRSFDPDAVAADELGMDDPWYGTDPAFDQTYAEIAGALPGILDHVRADLSRRGTSPHHRQ